MAEGGDFDDLDMKETERREEEDEDEDYSEDDEDNEDDAEDEDEDDDDVVTIKRPSGDIPKVGKDVGDMRRSMTWERKRFFERYLGLEIRVEDGPTSKDLLRRTKLLYNKDNRIRGQVSTALRFLSEQKKVVLEEVRGQLERRLSTEDCWVWQVGNTKPWWTRQRTRRQRKQCRRRVRESMTWLKRKQRHLKTSPRRPT